MISVVSDHHLLAADDRNIGYRDYPEHVSACRLQWGRREVPEGHAKSCLRDGLRGQSYCTWGMHLLVQYSIYRIGQNWLSCYSLQALTCMQIFSL